MRRIVIAAMSTISGLVLLFSYHTSTNRTETAGADAGAGAAQAPAQAGPATDPQATTDPDLEANPDPSATASAPSTTSSSGSSSSGTYTGDRVGTRWGAVQVRITLNKGRITKSEAIVYPDNNPRDVEINDYALPVLAQEVVQAQSAQIDFVSGATVTSDGYIQSLQSAIDQAHK